MQIGELITEYKRSSSYRLLCDNSKTQYNRYLDMLYDFRHDDIGRLTRSFVIGMRDEVGERSPAMGNGVLNILQVLLKHAVDRDHLGANPALQVRRLPVGEWRAWDWDAVNKWELHATGTARKLFLLGLYTGQRRGDIIKMRWRDIEDNVLYVVQEKTKAEVWVPLHSELLREMKFWDYGEFVLTSPTGLKMTASNFERIFYDTRRKLGTEEYNFHGLRKVAAARLAEAGCTDREIMSITGHQSVNMVSLYTRQADMKRRAVNAMRKLETQASA